jgi:N-acetylglucosaminyldiphosphoundecaprenol N-acetyl-beta-D-mannosaminyltransferase
MESRFPIRKLVKSNSSAIFCHGGLIDIENRDPRADMNGGSNELRGGDVERVREVRVTRPVLGVPIDVVSWETALERIANWADKRESRYVCLCNAHSVVTTKGDREFAGVVQRADMATPDGMPVTWMLRRFGFADQERVNGPDLMWRYCADAERRGEAVYFYGCSAETLAKLRIRLAEAFPRLVVAGMHSPPYRPLTESEDEELINSINDSGAQVVFVSLGCPKQEKWMAEHRGRIRAVMMGVGAAFSYHAGTLKRAPVWMRNHGLEWLHRLASEPRRLWKRYLVTNTMFVLGAVRQLTFDHVGSGRSRRH